MSFLLPLAWWLSLLSLPVIALYLLKTRQRRRRVSTLLFWNQIKPKVENSPLWRKLRRWLSLLLQLLILALVVAALARPSFDWEKRATQRTVAILDTSASMEAASPAPSRRELAARRVETLISRLRIQDEMALLTAEDPPRILSGWTSSKRALREALAQAGQLPTGTDAEPAVALARQLTALRENARVAVFSDAVWPREVRDAASLDIRGVDSAPPVNAGFTHFAVRRSPVAPGEWQLDAEIISTTPFKGRLELARDGQPMDSAEVQCEPGRSWKKSWRGNSEGGAHLEAVLQPAPGDMLAADNRASCTLAPLRPVRVYLSGPENPYIEAVLDSLPLVKWSRLIQMPLSLPKDVDLVITGGGDLPEKDVSTAALLLINPAREGFWGRPKGMLEDAPVNELDRKSPLLRHVSLEAVGISEAGDWEAPPGVAVLAQSMGHPLVFGQWDRSPRWMVVGFDPMKSDVVLRTAFPILLGNIIQSLREDGAEKQGAAVLPGRVESELHPLVAAREESVRGSFLPGLPGWWLVLLAGLLLLVAEWYLYSRRITD